MNYLLESGGMVIYPLLICSIIALTIIIERLYHFSRTPKEINDEVMAEIKAQIKAGEAEEAIKLCEEIEGPIAKILKKGIFNLDKEVEEIEKQMEEIELSEFPKLEKYLGLLNFIGKVSPSLGLLGTVTGMIRTFQMF
ncbi:MotA/TolQ/ExbB proton channel family protein [Natroniella acetigena]|uniref:MotA/TolQ/ExbB proton channel family protein n=1 Tax=Natroniella acetigena TaxID=52004 RepID=UPI0024A97D48|nr:MotA/TolQ/ExbB proton channel family protein [Natroniella acetigena]